MNTPLRICICLCLTVVGLTLASPYNMDSQSVGQNAILGKENFLDEVYNQCVTKGSVKCIKDKLYRFVENALSKDEISLTEGVTVVRTSGNPGDGAPRSLNMDETPKDIESLLVKRVQRYLSEHSIKVDIKGDDVVNAVSRAGKSISDMVSQFVGEEETSAEESRGKKKKKNKALMQMLMMLKFKLIALLPFIMGKIALIAGKALLLGKIALVLSLIVVLQKVLSQQHQKTVTYEVVPQAHHDVHGHESYGSAGGADLSAGGYGGGSTGGWGRSMDAHKMAFSAQEPSTL